MRKYFILTFIILFFIFYRSLHRFMITNFFLKEYVFDISVYSKLKDVKILQQGLYNKNTLISIYSYKNLQLYEEPIINEYLRFFVKTKLLLNIKKINFDKNVIPLKFNALIDYIPKLGYSDYRIRNYYYNRLNKDERLKFNKNILMLKKDLLNWCSAWKYALNAQKERSYLLNTYFAFAENHEMRKLIKERLKWNKK